MMARGIYIVEFDHDDTLLPNTLQMIIDAGNMYPDAGFIYTETCPIYEETGKSLVYGEYVGFGYCGYEAVKVGKIWLYCVMTARLNPMSISHLVGMPNHARVWRTELYRKLGGNNSRLSVADDYELMVKSFLDGKFICIPEPGYIQYHNTGGNNFTYKRNAMIQLLNKYTYKHFETKIEEKFKSLNIRTEKTNAKCWENLVDTYYPEINYTYFPNSSTCISIILPITPENAPNNNLLSTIISKTISILYQQSFKNWRLHISSTNIPFMKHVMNSLVDICDQRIRWWNMNENKVNDIATAKNYALRIMARSKYVTYINIRDCWEQNKLQSLYSNIQDKDIYIDNEHTVIHANYTRLETSYWKPDETPVEFYQRCTC